MLCTHVSRVDSTLNGTERNGTRFLRKLRPDASRGLAVYESEMQAELMHGRRKRKPAMHWEHESSEPDPIMRAGFQS